MNKIVFDNDLLLGCVFIVAGAVVSVLVTHNASPFYWALFVAVIIQ